jgi:glycosyltransferase involved in cell wall biosynthesis
MFLQSAAPVKIPMKIVVLDPGLQSKAGHHFHLDLILKEQARDHGVEDVVVYGYRGMDPVVATELAARPIFDIYIYTQVSGPPELAIPEGFNVINRVFAENLTAGVDNSFGPDDLIVVHTVLSYHLVGLYLWYAELPEPRPKLFMILRFPPWFRVEPEQHNLAVSLYQYALSLWGRFPEDRVALAADSPGLAKFYSKLVGRPVAELPIPIIHDGPPPAIPALETEERLLNFVYLGEARFEKGFHLLLQAIEAARSLLPNVRFTIQAGRYNELREFVDAWQERMPDVDFVTRELSGEDYFALLSAADAVLIPYNPIEYNLRTSHIFLEAIGAGKPVMVTAGTWMDLELARYGAAGVRAGEFSAAGMLEGLVWLSKSWSELAVRTAEAAATCRRTHNPEVFFNEVMALFPPVENNALETREPDRNG